MGEPEQLVTEVGTPTTASNAPESGWAEPESAARRSRDEPVSPIIAEHRLSRFDLALRLPPARPRVAMVVVNRRGDYDVFGSGRQPSVAELLRRRANSITEVDMGHHQMYLRADLPSRGDAFGFRAVVDVHWRVEDPSQVVRDGLVDVCSALAPGLLAELRSVTRDYEVRETDVAERAANSTLRRREVGADFGLRTTSLVQLAMDDAVREGIRLESRMAGFRAMIAAGDLNQFALQLAQEPQDTARVMEQLFRERDAHRKATVDFVTRLIDSGAVDRWEIDDQVRTVLQWLQDSTRAVITGTDEARQFRLGDRADGKQADSSRPAAS
jgi:hypothetical protein